MFQWISWADDGTLEAMEQPESRFRLAVQWHPEWRVTENPFYRGIFQAFAAACRERAESRQALPA